MRIVFICTTNVWGSAMAELISRQLLSEWDADRELIQVYSAGVRAQIGAHIPASAQQVLAEHGIDGSTHRARWMSPEVLAAADLTLTMGEVQRDAALALNPRGLRSTFILREAAALLESLPPVVAPMAPDTDRHTRAIAAAMAEARRFRSVAAGSEDLPDLMADDACTIRKLAGELSRDVFDLLRAMTLPEAVGSAQARVATPTAALARVSAIA